MPSGESLELQTKRVLEDQLAAGELGLSGDSAVVLHRKPYYSRDRGGNITFDVAIEVSRLGATEPYFVWIWECKDLARAVSVDDVEEFASKLQQIGVHGAKGSMASRRGFQRAAVEYAKSKHIGLLRLLPDGSTIRLLEAFRQLTDDDVVFGLTHPDSEELLSAIFGLSTSGVGVDQLSDLVEIEMATRCG